MIVTFLRSSSYNAHEMCPHSFFLAYACGIKSPAGLAASKGNVVHKALEVLAWQSKCRAEGRSKYDDETFGTLKVDAITPEWALEAAYDHYRRQETHLGWSPRDRRDCAEWLEMALTGWQGYFHPANLDIVTPEVRFDLTIAEPWAAYEYETPEGTTIAGQLGLKGTVDLVVRDPHDPQSLEVIDWKTGRRKDWATGEEKSYKKLLRDPQLLLYYYALSKVFPDHPYLTFTILFIRDGGPYRMAYTPDDLVLAEALLREKFRAIRDEQVPRLKKSWRCTAFCHFGKTMSTQDPSRTICEFMADEVRTKGILETMRQHQAAPNAHSRYGEGGGRRDSE